MKILRIDFEHVPALESPVSVDFLAPKNVTITDKGKLHHLTGRMYLNPVVAFTGLNASGKTTLLKLIVLVMKLMQSVPLNLIEECRFLRLEDGEHATVRVFFQEGNDIWLLESDIRKATGRSGRYGFGRETLSRYKNGLTGPKNQLFNRDKYALETDREQILEFLTTDGSMIVQFNNRKKAEIFVCDYMDYTNHNRLSVITSFPPELLMFLDPSIEYLRFDMREGTGSEPVCEGVRLKFHDSEEIVMPSPDFLERYLSSGTIKGLSLFVSALATMINGGYLVVDELENHFNAQIAASLIKMFLDPSVNVNGGTLIFSTHYPLLMDELDRNDCIYILKNKGKITMTRLDAAKERKDVKKSEAFISGCLEGTTPPYMAYRNLCRAVAQDNRERRTHAGRPAET